MKLARKFLTTISVFLFTLALVTSASAAVGDTTIVSVNSNGIQGNADSVLPAISADGKYIAFYSYAWNLMDNDYNLAADVFVRNLATGKTILVSANSNGVQGNDESRYPSISADGRYIAFESLANNLVVGDTNDRRDIFVRDLVAGTTIRVSVDSNEEQTNGGSYSPWISSDGSYVAFESLADNLVNSDTNGHTDIFVRDLQAGVTTRVSVDSNGIEANGYSGIPSISSDGHYVAFYSAANNLVSGDTNFEDDVFVHDSATGVTTRVSVSSSGQQGNGSVGDASLAISGDGRYVAFYSYANNLVTGDTNDVRDVFVHDLTTKKTTRVSVDSSGNQGNDHSYYPSISADGRYVAFDSFADNLVSNDTNYDGLSDVFVYDLETGTTTRVSVATGGAESNGGSGVGHSSLSADGRFVVFQSSANNLVSPDANSTAFDIFIHETGAVSSQTFVDVPLDHPLYKYIEALYDAGFTAGCSTSPLMFCPDTILDRAQSAVFMLRGQLGSGYTPPPAPWTNFINESWVGFEWAQGWAEVMYQEGLTTGCQASPLKFCPANQLPRVEASIFGLKMKYGVAYVPPTATGTLFADFPSTDPSYWGIDWAEQAYLDGLLPACGTDSGTGKPLFCPSELVNRGWGAYLIVQAKGLPTP